MELKAREAWSVASASQFMDEYHVLRVAKGPLEGKGVYSANSPPGGVE